MPTVSVTEFTDPGCPFAFSAEPQLWRLRWLFGDQLEWRLRLIVLAETREEYATKGLTPEMVAEGGRRLAASHGMPIDEAVKPAVAATLPACRAIVAARLRAPTQERPLLRALRRRHFAGALLDDPATIEAAVRDVGLDPAEVARWGAEEATERAVREDMLMARDPTPAALALAQKLARTVDDGWRYTCPSLELRTADGGSFSVPGFQSTLGYETALANVEPQLERRPEPDDVAEVLAWAGTALATAEVAEVCAVEREEARTRLQAAGALPQPVGRDAFWTLP